MSEPRLTIDIWRLDPKLTRREDGSWLATTDERSTVRIGVIGSSEEEARSLFRESLERWRNILEEINS